MKKLFYISLFVFSFNIQASVDCKIFKDIGCLITPDNNHGRLIIFFRGHFQGTGRVPPSQTIKSALSVIRQFKLKNFSEINQSIILVTGSSHLSINSKILSQLEFEYKELYFAAHSGGYKGLGETLKNIKPDLIYPKKIIMLDNFYSTQEDFHSLLENSIQEGSHCVGFLTKHNLERYRKYYRHLGCVANGPQGFSHSGSVPACLKQFLTENKCTL